MVPTLFGRIQTRLWLLAVVGALVTAALTPVLPMDAPLADKYQATFVVLGAVAVIGIAWEFLYHLLMQWRWEKDWPTMFGLFTGIPEGLLVGYLATQGWLPFLPDAYFEVTHPSGDVQCVLVEIDMGTLTLRRFARKVQAFEAALDDGVFRRHFKRDEFEVLVLTLSRRRLEWLRQTAGRVVNGGRHGDYRLATFDVLAPDVFGTGTWRDLDGDEYRGVLYDG